MAVEFYSHLFRADPDRRGEFSAGHFPDLEHMQKEVWEADWTVSEVKKALSEMGSWKAPDPYMYQPGFFKRTWDTTGKTVHSFVQALLKGGEVTNDDVKALLVLMPKKAKLFSLKNFCPMSLCNVRMKLIFKMIANRLKPLLKDLILPNQASFTLGRQSLDNVVV